MTLSRICCWLNGLTKVSEGIKLREVSGTKMKGDEFKIILEDINKKFDVLIAGHKSLKEQLERYR
jgi:hypothetical protein